tara:strand:+ start:54 stop:524 length:471 start_codon:yes stop_codon:yes gene_type:complete
MASTITSATLTVKITEEVNLNGRDQGSINEFTIGSINEVYKRIVSVPTSEIEIIKMDTSAGAGQFIEGDVRYIRITNKDDTNNVFLTFKNEDNDEFSVLLDYGQSFIYNSNLDGGVVNTFDANAGAANINNLGDLVNITAQADTAAVDLELFVASI